MAANTNNKKRTPIRYIRDGIKQQYRKESCCEICGVSEDLELHHYHTVAFLLEKHVKEHSIPMDTEEQILAMRDKFYQEYWHELVEDAVTLCNSHHVKLHGIYGQKPLLTTAEKQKLWVLKQKDRANGIIPEQSKSSGIGQYADYTPKSLLDFMV